MGQYPDMVKVIDEPPRQQQQTKEDQPNNEKVKVTKSRCRCDTGFKVLLSVIALVVILILVIWFSMNDDSKNSKE